MSRWTRARSYIGCGRSRPGSSVSVPRDSKLAAAPHRHLLVRLCGPAWTAGAASFARPVSSAGSIGSVGKDGMQGYFRVDPERLAVAAARLEQLAERVQSEGYGIRQSGANLAMAAGNALAAGAVPAPTRNRGSRPGAA